MTVRVFEGLPFLGGRASTFRDADGEWIEQGLQLFLGSYSEFRTLLIEIGRPAEDTGPPFILAWIAAYLYWFGATLAVRGNVYRAKFEHGSFSLVMYNNRFPGLEASELCSGRARPHRGSRMGYISGTFRETIRDGGPSPHTIITGARVPFSLLITAPADSVSLCVAELPQAYRHQYADVPIGSGLPLKS